MRQIDIRYYCFLILFCIYGCAYDQQRIVRVNSDPIRCIDYFTNTTEKDATVYCFSFETGEPIEMIRVPAHISVEFDNRVMYQISEDFTMYDVASFSQRDSAMVIFSDAITSMHYNDGSDNLFKAEVRNKLDTVVQGNISYIEEIVVSKYFITDAYKD